MLHLGKKLTEEGVEVDPNRVMAIINTPSPKDKEGMPKFNGQFL